MPHSNIPPASEDAPAPEAAPLPELLERAAAIREQIERSLKQMRDIEEQIAAHLKRQCETGER